MINKRKISFVAAGVLAISLLAGCGLFNGKDIGKDAALNAALEDAGIQQQDTTRLQVREDRDDGRKIYEIQFDAGDMVYEYEVRAADGSIQSVEKDRISGTGSVNTDNAAANANGQNSQNTQPEQNTQSTSGAQPEQNSVASSSAQAGNPENGSAAGGTSNSNSGLSQEDAAAIALERVPGASSQDIWIKSDFDDGRNVYEGEIRYNGTEYEFKIDINTGEVIEWSTEKA